MFEDSGDGGAYGDSSFSCVYFIGGVLGKVVVLGVHVVLVEVFDFDGAKGADADVKGEEGVVDGGEDFGGEVEASGGGGDGAFFFGEDGLVSVAVGGVVIAVHVVGEGEMAVSVFVDGFGPFDETVSVVVDGGDSSGCLADFDGASGFHFLPGTNHGTPESGGEFVEADELDCSAVGEVTGGNDFGVEVVGLEEVGEVGEGVVGDAASGAVDVEEARLVALFKGSGGDEFFGKVVVEVGGGELICHRLIGSGFNHRGAGAQSFF